jgi:hypothetical protein
MNHRHQTPEQIGLKLREANRLLSEGTLLVEMRKNLEVAQAKFNR